MRIEISGLEEHDPIPRERQLAERFGVSRVSIRQALAILNENGLIYTIHGSGSFVAPLRETSRMRLHSFTEEMDRRGLKPTTKILNFDLLSPGSEKIDDWMPITQSYYRIERLRLGNNEPMSYEISYVAEEIAPSLIRKKLSGSLYEILAREYKIEVASADEVLLPIIPNNYVAKQLKLEANTPALEIRRECFNTRGEKIETSRSIRSAERWEFRYTVRS